MKEEELKNWRQLEMDFVLSLNNEQANQFLALKEYYLRS